MNKIANISRNAHLNPRPVLQACESNCSKWTATQGWWCSQLDLKAEESETTQGGSCDTGGLDRRLQSGRAQQEGFPCGRSAGSTLLSQLGSLACCILRVGVKQM